MINWDLFLQVLRVVILFLFLNIFCFIFSYLFFLFFPLFWSPLPPPEKRSKGLFHQITKTHGTVIGVSSGIVLVLLIISILVQMKQPRKKVTHALWLTSSSAGKPTKPEKKRLVAESDGGIPDQMAAHIALEAERKTKSTHGFYTIRLHIRNNAASHLVFSFKMIFFWLNHFLTCLIYFYFSLWFVTMTKLYP